MPGDKILGPSLSQFFDPQSACTIGDIHSLNEKSVLPTIEDLTKSTFFKFFKVDLDAECPYWVIDKICKSGSSCTIGRCEEEEVPICVRDFDTNHKSLVSLPSGKVLPSQLPSTFEKWNDTDANMWAYTQLDSCNPRSSYVDLRENVESNTGYAGDEPRMIWNAIYNENCFQALSNSDPSLMCSEERLFYRLISGMHTEISVHVFAKWKRDPFTLEFMKNQGVWNIVFGKFPERLDSLYYTLNFLLESFHALEPYSDSLLENITTGNEDEDKITRQLFAQLLSSSNSCNYKPRAGEEFEALPPQLTTTGIVAETTTEVPTLTKTSHSKDDIEAYDVDREFADVHSKYRTPIPHSSFNFPSQPLFQTDTTLQLKDQLKNMFRNVSRIMNCVGCEKCRVWSKLHTLGMATALKVAIAKPGSERSAIVGSLQRNELVALVNSIYSFSEAVHFVSDFMELQKNPTTLDVSTPFEADSSTGTNTDANQNTSRSTNTTTSPYFPKRLPCTVMESVQTAFYRVLSKLPLFRHYFPSLTTSYAAEDGSLPTALMHCLALDDLSAVYIGFALLLVLVSIIVSFFKCDGDDGVKNRVASNNKKAAPEVLRHHEFPTKSINITARSSNSTKSSSNSQRKNAIVNNPEDFDIIN